MEWEKVKIGRLSNDKDSEIFFRICNDNTNIYLCDAYNHHSIWRISISDLNNISYHQLKVEKTLAKNMYYYMYMVMYVHIYYLYIFTT